jgi:hypothetical protein
MYFVVVTHGSIPNQVYSWAASHEDALALKQAAIELGYSDARVMLQSDYRLQYGRYQLANHVPPRPPTHVVTITLGNEAEKRAYARSSSLLGAMALRNTAREKGYDAEIMDARAFRQAEAARRAVQADQASAA